MSIAASLKKHRSRELRRRVVLPARMRTGVQWSDTCILNISSRGLLVHSGHAVPEGAEVEIRRGEYVITARVAWRDGGRIGLQSDERLPVEEILSLGKSPSLQLVAAEGALVERRKSPRALAADARMRGRALEMIGVGTIAVALALSLCAGLVTAFAKPLAEIETKLG